MTYARYIYVWLGLIVLTALTVTIADLNFGKVAIVVAMTVAATKSVLVVLYFMHMRTEKRLILKLLLPIALATLAIFIGLTFTDVLHR